MGDFEGGWVALCAPYPWLHKAKTFNKLSLLQAYIAQHDFDVVCLSETFLNSSENDDSDRRKIDGYSFSRSDHPSNLRKDEVCIYYKEHTPLVTRDYLCSLHNCLVAKILSYIERCFLTCLYPSPSQNNAEFKNFCVNLHIILSNINQQLPLCSIVRGDVIARYSKWSKKISQIPQLMK